MNHYTTHRGQMHHFPCGPYMEEQVIASEGGPGYLVAHDPRAFKGAHLISAARHKPGVCRVIAVWTDGNKATMNTIYAKDELLPAGTEIEP